MHKPDRKGSSAGFRQPKYFHIYQKIKGRCRFQRDFSTFLLAVFFTLQYSVPIFLVVLGSVASSREQLATFFSSNAVSDAEKSSDSGSGPADSDLIISRIIYLIGLTTILLGVINNIVRPAESYDTAAKYNNEFVRFEQNLDLKFLELSSYSDYADDNDLAKALISFLSQKNDELCALIQEYNDARSLSPRQTHLQVLNQEMSEGGKPSDDMSKPPVDEPSPRRDETLR